MVKNREIETSCSPLGANLSSQQGPGPHAVRNERLLLHPMLVAHTMLCCVLHLGEIVVKKTT